MVVGVMEETVEDIVDVVVEREAEAQEQGEAKTNIFMDNLTCLLKTKDHMDL